MANVLIFNKDNGRVLGYKLSVNTPDYSGRDDVLINPDISVISGVKRQYLIVDNGSLREMTVEEKESFDAEKLAEENAIILDKDNDLDITVKEFGIAWLQMYNSRVPTQYQISKAEMITKIRENRKCLD